MKAYLKLLLKFLKVFYTVFQVGKVVVVKAFARARTLFTSGFWSWLMLTTVLVFEHREAIGRSVASLSPRPLIVSYGTQLGQSIFTALDALQKIPHSHGLEYLTLGLTVVSAVAHVLWYFKAVFVLSTLVDPDVSPVLIWGFTGTIYFVVVWKVTGWVPTVETVEALSNVVDLLEFGRVNPLFNGNTTVANETLRNGTAGG